MNRNTRRRLERELLKTKQAPGVGKGWRLNNRGRRYPVGEPQQPIDVERLILESDAAAARIAKGER